MMENIEMFKLHFIESLKYSKLIIKDKIKYLFKEKKMFFVKRISLILLSYFVLFSVYNEFKIERDILLRKLGLLSKIKYLNESVDQSRDHQAFLTKISILESGNHYNPRQTNSNYLGKYQIGYTALLDIGINVSKQDFLTIHILQESAMMLLLRKNKSYLVDLIGKYNSKTINGIYITESGILAAAHLTGHTGIRKYLESHGVIDMVDGNGIKTSKYLKELGGYNLKL